MCIIINVGFNCHAFYDKCLGFWSTLVFNWNVFLRFGLTICDSEQHCWIHFSSFLVSHYHSFSLSFPFLLLTSPPFPSFPLSSSPLSCSLRSETRVSLCIIEWSCIHHHIDSATLNLKSQVQTTIPRWL